MPNLSRAEIIGIAHGLFEAGAAVSRTPDPDCDAAELFGEGAWWDTLGGLPGYGGTAAARASQERFRAETLARLKGAAQERQGPDPFEVSDDDVHRAALAFWRAAEVLTNASARHHAVMWAVTLEELRHPQSESGGEATARLLQIAERATQPE